MRKSVHLTFKNSIKNTFSNFSQLFGMIMLVTMLALVITLMTSINDRVLSKHEQLIKDSNQHNVVLKMDPDLGAIVQANSLGYKTTNNTEAQQYLVKELQKAFKDDADLAFNWSRTEGRDFSQTFNEKGQQMTVKAVSKLTIDGSTGVDNLVLSSGRKPADTDFGWHEVVLDSTFAEINNIQIGSLIRMQLDDFGEQFLVTSDKNAKMTEDLKKDLETIKSEGIAKAGGLYERLYSNYGWFQVVGLGNSADFMAPVLTQAGVLPNRETEALVYLQPQAMGIVKNDANDAFRFDISLGRLEPASTADQEVFYSFKTINGKEPSYDLLQKMNDYFRTEILKNNDKSAKYIYGLSDHDYVYVSRTSMIESTIKIYQIIAGCILILIFGVALYVMALITKKQIEKARGQIGVMKALGYKKISIITNFIMTPLITSIIGGVLGFIISIGVQSVLVSQLKLYFSLDIAAFSFDWVGFLVVVIFMWVALTAIAFLMAWLILRASALSLIAANQSAKINRWGLFVKKINLRRSFGSKLRTALLIDAGGKMAGVGLVVLFSTFLMTISYLAPNILNKYKTMSFNGINYEQLVEYAEPVANNPYTFLKTYNKNSTYNGNGEFDNFKYSSKLQGITGLPLNEDGSYDMAAITKAYVEGNVSSDFYSPFIKTANEIPTSQELSYANSRMLVGSNVALSNSFLKYMAHLAQPMDMKAGGLIGMIANRIMWGTLSNEWVDRRVMIEELKNIYSSSYSDMSNINEINKIFNIFQQFYLKYINSIGLTISNLKGENLSQEEIILRFNKNQNNLQNEKYLTVLEEDNDFMFSKVYMTSLEQNIVKDITVKISDGINDKKFSIQAQDSGFDFSRYNPENETNLEIRNKNMQIGIYEFLIWYSAMFGLRVDEAIIQAAYSRAPYFVQQYMKKDWDSETYTQAFNVINFNFESDELGTLLRARNNKLNFKIFGISGEKNLMQLFDKDKELNKLLYKNNKKEIVINKTLSKKLDIKSGDSIIVDIEQNVLKHNGKIINLSQWKDEKQNTNLVNKTLFAPALGEVPHYDKEMGFIQQSAINPLHSTIVGEKAADAKEDISIYSKIDPMKSPQVHSPLFEDYLKGNWDNSKVSHSEEFKVVGIHEQYGEPAAWINNDVANEILGYDKVQEYLWENQFVPQFGNFFENPDLEEYKLKNYDANKFKKFADFETNYLKPEIDSKEEGVAHNILKLFQKVDPVFNYKYSKDPNMGDLDSLISVWTQFGDYNPTTMNGNNKDVEGIGQSGFSGIVPVEMSKAILNQISNVILSVLVLIILLVLVLTFVIILLTTSLIISDNAKFISTMKVLGYSNKYIAKNMLGMYFIVIAITFVIGFVASYLLSAFMISFLAKNTALVLPFSFTWWILPAVILSVMGIYAVTIAVGFKSIAKINPTHVLQAQTI